MPIYEYLCESCGHEMEKIQKMSDEPLKECPSCAKSALRKLVSAAAFRLKGDGWYETDFKTGSKKNALHRPDNGSDSSNTSSDSSNTSSDSSKSDQKKSNSTDTKKSESSTKSSTKSTTGSASGSTKGTSN